jgi:D-alanyl-lipoteichoic acid acyltransferase DltB (MBOAT superfamily)
MSNNYSPMEFWRNWHRSFNRWLIRYVYVPLGGKRNYAVNIWPIFTFVAVWHDIQLRLLYWGWLIALFILPEIACTRLFCTSKVLHCKLRAYARCAAGLATGTSIFVPLGQC